MKKFNYYKISTRRKLRYSTNNFSQNPYFKITRPTNGGEVLDEYGFWISIEEYDDLCFMDFVDNF